MIRKTFFLAVALLLPALSQAQVKLLRHPTYSNGKVAFSYLGDIWIANENGSDVQRLTDNKARDVFPRFSPDGKWIAFSSNREGNYDVYVIPATGGKPRQLTFHSADDNVVGWTPDGKNIIFSSARGNGVFPTVATLWEVPVDGGIERPIQTDWGAWASYSPDGSKTGLHPPPRRLVAQALSRQLRGRPLGDGRGRQEVHQARRRRLQGQLPLAHVRAATARSIFVSDQLANEKGIKFGGPEVMKSVNNIWKISDKGGKDPSGHPPHRRQSLLPQHLGRRQDHRLRRQLRPLETRYRHRQEHRNPHRHQGRFQGERDRAGHHHNEAEGFHLSPSNKRAAIVGPRRDLHHRHRSRRSRSASARPPGKSRSPRWSPNGKWIAFVSDRTGREEVWISDELGKNREEAQRRRLRQERHRLGARFQVAAVDRHRSQAAPRGYR